MSRIERVRFICPLEQNTDGLMGIDAMERKIKLGCPNEGKEATVIIKNNTISLESIWKAFGKRCRVCGKEIGLENILSGPELI